MSERVAIVGTAPSWRKTPWADPGIRILGLNDAYQLQWPRADGWYDIHPMHKFFLAKKGQQVYAHQVPAGHYVRPEHHLDWLSKLSIPLWLHDTPPEGWGHAHRFPWEAVEAEFGCYFSSSPALMLAHVIMQGAKEIHIYGIHLATEHEYLEQRPNFEYLIGRALGAGKIREHHHDGLRTLETEDARIVLPDETPILRASFKYARETRPGSLQEPIKWELHKLQIKHARAVKALKTRKWYQSPTPAQNDLWYLEAAMEDARQSLQRLQMAGG